MSMDTSSPVHALLQEVDPEGKLEPCGLRELVLGPGALEAVTGTVAALLAQAPGQRAGRPTVALLVDRTPILRQGADVKDVVERQLAERFAVTRTVLDDGSPELHVVDPVLREASLAAADVDAVVAVGGGTISDIAKLAAVPDDGRPAPVLVAVQTAASVDGYTDDVSVVLRDGVKRTVPSRWPDAVVADAETIAEAPALMNRAGFGEMTSMLVAPADWCLAGLVGTDPTFHEAPIRLLQKVGQDIDAWSDGVRNADPAAVAALTKALALRGIATGVAGTTAVLSGVEHLVSHMLDQHHTAHHQPMGLHGAQVGAASVVAAAAWEMLFERLAVAGAAPPLDEAAFDRDQARARVDRAFAPLDPTGRIAAECWKDYARKLETVDAGRARLLGVLEDWPQHAPRLRGLVRPSAEIAAGLRAAGSPVTFRDLDPSVDDQLARWAVSSCALMRNRFVVLDLLTLLGWWDDEDVDEVLARAAASAAGPEGGV